MEQIITYLIDTYDPESIVLYGSYADGSYNAASDFDALVISPSAGHGKDTSVINGIQLDVWLFSPEETLDHRDFPQLYDSRIILDKNGKAEKFCREVKAYIDGFPTKSGAEIEANLVWCEKMFQRTVREDAEGYFRWHWLLCDSLEFYCDICYKFYFGPKKTLRWMEREDGAAFAKYSDALTFMDRSKLEQWIIFLRKQWDLAKSHGRE